MIHIEADSQEQVLTMRFVQQVDVAQVEDSSARLDDYLRKLAPGFRMLTDLSELDHMDHACATGIGRMMDAIAARGVKTVLRVIPDPRKDIGFGLLSSFHYGGEVRVVTHDTLEAALDGLAP